MEEQIEMSQEEHEQLLSEDPTPEVGRYKKSAAERKRLAQYQRDYRERQKEAADVDDWDARIWAKRKENARSVLESRIWLALGEISVNQIGNLEQQLQSALTFQSLLGLPDPKPNQTYAEFFQCVFDGWRKLDFPLLVIRANIGLNPNRNFAYHNGFIGQPLAGMDQPLPEILPEPLGRKEWMESSEQFIRESETLYRWPQPKHVWIFNPVTGFNEPAPWLSEIPRRN